MIKAAQFAIIGFLISLSSSYILLTLNVLSVPNRTVSGKELLEQIVIAAILGISIGLISLIFETERLSFTIQLFIHFSAVTICVLAAGYLGDWYDVTNMATIISLVISIVVIYLISWGIILLVLKREIVEINHMIQKKRKS